VLAVFPRETINLRALAGLACACFEPDADDASRRDRNLVFARHHNCPVEVGSSLLPLSSVR